MAVNGTKVLRWWPGPVDWLRRLRDALDGMWFRPLVLLLVGVVLGEGLPRLDHAMATDWRLWEAHWLFKRVQASPDGAWQLLGVAAGILATIVSVAFSITTVTVQLASTQYTPRLLRHFMADRVTQRVLGCFIGSIAYLVLVLRSVRGPDAGDSDGFVPLLSLLIGTLCFVACLGLLPVFLHHLTRSIQASTVVTLTARRTIEILEGLAADGGDEGVQPPELGPPGTRLTSASTGYLQVFDERALVQALPAGCTLARAEVAVGDFVLPGMPLVSLWPEVEVSGEEQRRMRGAFAFARERNHPQDVLFGVRQLVDVALKALSPGINDVTTAIMALNELGALTVALARTQPPTRPGWRAVAHERRALLVPTLGMEAFLAEAFDEVVLAAQHQPRVLARVLELLGQLCALAQRRELCAAYLRAGERVHLLAERSGLADVVLREVVERWERLQHSARNPGMSPPPPPYVQ